jgi:hypothetical protein
MANFTVFFDTEFTQLDEVNGVQTLISIGCVTPDGREFYAELTDTWHVFNCSEFVVDVVLPLLDGGVARMSEAELAGRLRAWLEALSPGNQIIFRSDCPMADWKWVERLFNDFGWPTNLRKKCGTIYFNHDVQIQRYQDALGTYWKEYSERQHHALVDARSLAFASKLAIRRGI